MDKNMAGIIQSLTDLIVSTEIKLRAMDDLIVEKGLMTREEISQKFNDIHDEKFKQIRDELLNSFKENSKNY